MRLELFVLVDKSCGFPRRVLADLSAGKMLRDTIKQDIGVQPGQIPFKDSAYYRVGYLDYDTLAVTPCKPELLDVLKEYQFEVETPANKEAVSESRLKESVDNGEL